MVTIKKTLADTPALGNGSVQRVKVEESARHKLVNLRVRTALTGYLLGPDFKQFFLKYFSYKYVFSNSDLTMVQKVLLL